MSALSNLNAMMGVPDAPPSSATADSSSAQGDESISGPELQEEPVSHFSDDSEGSEASEASEDSGMNEHDGDEGESGSGDAAANFDDEMSIHGEDHMEQLLPEGWFWNPIDRKPLNLHDALRSYRLTKSFGSGDEDADPDMDFQMAEESNSEDLDDDELQELEVKRYLEQLGLHQEKSPFEKWIWKFLRSLKSLVFEITTCPGATHVGFLFGNLPKASPQQLAYASLEDRKRDLDANNLVFSGLGILIDILQTFLNITDKHVMADEDITRGVLNACTLAEVFEDIDKISQAWDQLNMSAELMEAKAQLQAVVDDFHSDFLMDPLCGGLGPDPIRVPKDMTAQQAHALAASLASRKQKAV